MRIDTFQTVRNWLKIYVSGYLAGDGALGEVSAIKWGHSLRVARHCREIAGETGWSDHDTSLAELLGLLHDAGRFSQFAEYGTFADAVSVDHGMRGVEVIQAAGVLDALPGIDRSRILDGILAHNQRLIPDTTPPEALPFARIVRDADKLDIFRIIMERIEGGAYREHLRSALQIERTGPATPGAVEEILRNETVSNGNIRTVADFGLMQISWVFDINYPPALRRILDLGYIDRIVACLPDGSGVRKAVAHIREHLLVRGV